MLDWEVAVSKFLAKWKRREDVIGAIVCGSYVTGNPSKHSDVDLHIILSDDVSSRERGNEVVDGFLIEYFANPLRKHYEYTAEDFKERRKINSHMFITGRVLFDKTGALKKFIEFAKKDFSKKYSSLSKVSLELSKYYVWDMCDNLEEVFSSGAEDFVFVYHNFLHDLFKHYSGFLRFDFFPAYRVLRFLTNAKDKKKYSIRDFPDKKFERLFVSAIKLQDKRLMMRAYKDLTDYVLAKMGGFNIDGFRIKSSV